MTHKKTWACVKPDGDGCDGNHGESMTNKERFTKLEEAEKLIREVEFSYPQGDPTRKVIFRAVVETFSYMGSLSGVMNDLEYVIENEKENDCE